MTKVNLCKIIAIMLSVSLGTAMITLILLCMNNDIMSVIPFSLLFGVVFTMLIVVFDIFGEHNLDDDW